MLACAPRAQRSVPAARRRTVVVAAAGKRGGGGKRAGGGGKQQKPRREERGGAPASTHRSKTAAMTEFRADEVLMFDPVPAERGALQARGCCRGCWRAARVS